MPSLTPIPSSVTPVTFMCAACSTTHGVGSVTFTSMATEPVTCRQHQANSLGRHGTGYRQAGRFPSRQKALSAPSSVSGVSYRGSAQTHRDVLPMS